MEEITFQIAYLGCANHGILRQVLEQTQIFVNWQRGCCSDGLLQFLLDIQPQHFPLRIWPKDGKYWCVLLDTFLMQIVFTFHNIFRMYEFTLAANKQFFDIMLYHILGRSQIYIYSFHTNVLSWICWLHDVHSRKLTKFSPVRIFL